MKKKKSDKIKLTLLILLVVITLGYAALRTGLNINGITNVSRSSWNVHFENYQMSNATNITPTTEPSISGDTTTSISYEVNLETPGDIYEFSVEVVNGGSLDALISLVSKYNGSEIGPGNTIPAYIEYTVTDENGDPIVDDHRLNHGNREIVKVFVKYKEDASVLPSQDATLRFDIAIEATQAEKENPPVPVSAMAYYDPVSTNTCDENTYNPTTANNGTSTCYKWHVLNSDGTNVELILDHSIAKSAWITDADYGGTAQHDKGPVTALNTLKNAINSWERVSLLNYSQEFSKTNPPTDLKTPGSKVHYDSLTCTNGTCSTDNNSNFVTGLRARLISVEEIAALTSDAIDYEAATLAISETWGVEGGWSGYDISTPYVEKLSSFHTASDDGTMVIGTYSTFNYGPGQYSYYPLSWLNFSNNSDAIAWTISPVIYIEYDSNNEGVIESISYEMAGSYESTNSGAYNANKESNLVPVIKVRQSDIDLES